MNAKVAGLTAGALGVAALIWGLFSNAWVTGEMHLGPVSAVEFGVGLRAVEQCETREPEDQPGPPAESCITKSHGEVSLIGGGTDFDTFTLLAKITFYSGLATAAVLVILLALALAGRFPDLPIAPSTAGIVLSFGTVVLGTITLVAHPWKGALGWGAGYSFILAGAGAVACLFAAIVLGRLRPRDEAW